MKKPFCLFFVVLFLCGALCACGEEQKAPVELTASPLLRLALPEGAEGETRLWYLPASNGFLYLHPAENGTFSGGFVSPLREISAEAIVTGAGNVQDAVVWETAADRAVIATPSALYLTLLKEGVSEERAIPASFGVETVYPFDSVSFLARRGALLLRIPLDLKEAYVLANTALLPGFSAPLCATHSGSRIYYAAGDTGAYTGFAFFEYGKNLPLGDEALAFQSYQIPASGAMLLLEESETGLNAHFLAPESEKRQKTALPASDAVSCTPSGALLCALGSKNDGDVFSFYDAAGTKRGSLLLPNAHAAKSFALSERTLFFAVRRGNEWILHTADLSELMK